MNESDAARIAPGGWVIGVMLALSGQPMQRHYYAVGHADRAKAEWTAVDSAVRAGDDRLSERKDDPRLSNDRGAEVWITEGGPIRYAARAPRANATSTTPTSAATRASVCTDFHN